MSELREIKEEIFNCGYVPKLLEDLGCDYVELKGNRFEAMLPPQFNSDNKRSVQVYNDEKLTSAVRSRNIKGDIFTLVAYLMTEETDEEYLNKQLYKTKSKIIDVLGMHEFANRQSVPKNDPNSWLKQIKAKQNKRIILSELDHNPVFPESVLDGFVRHPHIKFLKDGIDVQVQKEFDVGFDISTERVTFPIRNVDGGIVGVKGRRTKKDDDSKYLFLYPFKKAQELFNYHRAVEHVKEQNELLIFEGEKSVMRAYSYDYFNCMSTMGAEITRIQVEMIYRINPNLKVVLMLDKDKEIDDIKKIASVFKERFDKVWGMLDRDDLLNGKDSPVDLGKDTFDRLYTNNIYPIRLN
ncbi:DNA primase [Virgibacillus halotolerans]|uniref:DNA primase n=1 Tax=Virgibacillus halotolerans TaxID=1071053 RepID=UPI001961DF1B|nr:DNA primase [Virgibacillus halotolerans]